MAEFSKAELLRSLGRVVRGLSALFWGLPLAVVVYVQTARTDWLEVFGPLALLPSVIISCVVWHGLAQLRHFQKQERIWLHALNRAEVFALVNAGLSPFLFWWHRNPSVSYFSMCVGLLTLSCLLLLIQINRVLQRLTAMLPDEAVRMETRMFSNFNISMLSALFLLLCLYFGVTQLKSLPRLIEQVMFLVTIQGVWFVLFLILMPLAMTMALLWKIKQMIFGSVFNAE